MFQKFAAFSVACAVLLTGCGRDQPREGGPKAFVGARIIDGTGSAPIEDGVLVVRDGRVQAVGARAEVPLPANIPQVDVSGRTIVPGFINAHGHVGGTRGLESGHYSEDNILRQLGLYARYGVTTVNSLGGDGEDGVRVRDTQDRSDLDRARLYVAGDVVVGETPRDAQQMVDDNAAMNVDFIKIRVDDNLGTASKMRPEVYQAAIERTHEQDLRLASHMFYLEDAKALLRAGSDFLVHSVRDQEVDDEFIELLKERGVCYSPTLVREVSTFVYEDVPEFFADPFFLKEADPEVLEQLKDPERQDGIRRNRAAQLYKQALEVAQRNLKALADADVTIAFGTDTGPPARFQGYFEHMEMDLMADAGLNPMQIIVSATGDAARCLGLDDLGTLEESKWADFMVLGDDPLDDITNMRSIESVWIAGNRVGAGA